MQDSKRVLIARQRVQPFWSGRESAVCRRSTGRRLCGKALPPGVPQNQNGENANRSSEPDASLHKCLSLLILRHPVRAGPPAALFLARALRDIARQLQVG